MINNLIDVLMSYSKNERKGVRLIIHPQKEEFVSYKKILNISKYILYNLQVKGLKKGSEIILNIGETEIDKFVYVFWAGILGGIIPVPIVKKQNTEAMNMMFNVWDVMNDPYLITTKSHMEHIIEYINDKKLNEKYRKILSKVIYIDDLLKISLEGKVNKANENDIAFIQFSSGSTGSPKGVILTHKNIITNLRAIVERLNIIEDDYMLSWMPLTHNMGLILFHILPIMANINHTLMPAKFFVEIPYIWVKKASEHGATILASPNFGYKYLLNDLSKKKQIDLDLSKVRIIINGGEPVNTTICNEFLLKLSKYDLKKDVMFPGYGLAESAIAATVRLLDEDYTEYIIDKRYLGIEQKVRFLKEKDDKRAIIYTDVGRTVNDCFLRVCNDSGKILDENVIGNIQIKGGNVTKGYYNNLEATQAIKTNDGWIKTGDLGFIVDGRVVITGRKKDVVFVQAQNYYTYDIERVITQLDGISEGEVLVCGIKGQNDIEEKLIVFKLSKTSLDEYVEIAEKIKHIVFTKMGLLVDYVIPIDEIPKTASGKVRRYVLKEAYLNGKYIKIMNEMEKIQTEKNKETNMQYQLTNTEKLLKNVCTEILNIRNISVYDNFMHKGINSLILTKIYKKIHLIYPDKIKISDLYKYSSIAELAKFIDEDDNLFIDNVILSDEYFSDIYINDSEMIFETQIKGKEYSNIMVIAKQEGVDVYSILISLYLYLFSKLSNSRVCIQAITNNKGDVSDFSFEFENVKYFGELFKKVNNSQITKYNLEYLTNKNIKRLENGVIPIIYKKGYVSTDIKLTNIYDIVLQVESSSDKLNFVWEFNNKILNQNRVKEIAVKYMKLINTITDKY